MENEIKTTDESLKNTSEEKNSEKKHPDVVDWDGILHLDPLMVSRIIEANQHVEDLEEAGEL